MRTFDFAENVDSCYLFKLENMAFLDDFHWNMNEDQNAVGIYYDGKYVISRDVFKTKIEIITDKLNSILLRNGEEMVRNKYESITFKSIKSELFNFYYENQYDTEKYPHFMPCDRLTDVDENGDTYNYVVFYN